MASEMASHYECYCGNSWESYHTSDGSWCRQCGNEVWPYGYGQDDSAQYSYTDKSSSDSYDCYDSEDQEVNFFFFSRED